MRYASRWIGLGLALVLSGCGDCTLLDCVSVVEAWIPASRLGPGEWSWHADLPDADEYCFVTWQDGEVVSTTCTLWVPEMVDGDLVMTASPGPKDPVRRRVDMEVAWAPAATDAMLELLVLDWSEPVFPNGRACDGGMGCQRASVQLRDAQGGQDVLGAP